MPTASDLAPLAALLTQIEYARDDDHARALIVELRSAAEGLAGSLPPVLRNCRTCRHDYGDEDIPQCALIDRGTGDREQDAAIHEWIADEDNADDRGHATPTADGCPGWSARD